MGVCCIVCLCAYVEGATLSGSPGWVAHIPAHSLVALFTQCPAPTHSQDDSRSWQCFGAVCVCACLLCNTRQMQHCGASLRKLVWVGGWVGVGVGVQACIHKWTFAGMHPEPTILHSTVAVTILCHISMGPGRCIRRHGCCSCQGGAHSGSPQLLVTWNLPICLHRTYLVQYG